MSAYLEAFNAALVRVYASLTAPGAALLAAAGNPEPGSGPGQAGTGVVVHLDNYSRKVDDDFNPDDYPINRARPANTQDAYPLGDPKRVA